MKLNQKSKAEQLCFLGIMCMMCFFVLCLMGCGKKSCEQPAIGCESNDYGTAMGVKLPGCGGVLTSGEGCGMESCGLWSQALRAMGGAVQVPITDDNGQKKKQTFIGVAATDEYYGIKSSCLGCNTYEKRYLYGAAMVGGLDTWLISVGTAKNGELGDIDAKWSRFGGTNYSELGIGCFSCMPWIGACGACKEPALGGQATGIMQRLLKLND